MMRKIIKINAEECNSCALCVQACHEGAIGMENGKAKLLRDDYCDGLGDCLPVCPTGAITFEEREAAAYDEVAVKARMAEMEKNHQTETLACGCLSTHARKINRESESPTQTVQIPKLVPQSRLSQWPVQIKLAPVNAPYLDEANLLIAADCTAFAYGNFHERFMKNHVTLIGCPKLDEGDYAEKLTAILKQNNIQSITVIRMEVPCCGGIANAAISALQNCGKMIPWQVVTLSTDGQIIGE